MLAGFFGLPSKTLDHAHTWDPCTTEAPPLEAVGRRERKCGVFRIISVRRASQPQGAGVVARWEGRRKEGGVISVASNALRPATAAPQFADVVRKCRECPSRRTKWQKNALFR